MKFCRQWAKAALIVCLLLLGVLAVAVPMPVLRRIRGRRAAACSEAIILHWCRAAGCVLGLRLTIDGAPDPNVQFFVANHISWLDIIGLGSRQPGEFIAKEDVAKWPVLGFLAKGIGTLFVRRGDTERTGVTAERMVWRLRQGKRLVLFPEGTTTDGRRVSRFHGKLFQPAERTGARVQAIALRYLGQAAEYAPFVGDDAFLPHLLAILELDRIELRITYCPPLPVGLQRGEMALAARRQIAALVGPAGGGTPERCRPQCHAPVIEPSR